MLTVSCKGFFKEHLAPGEGQHIFNAHFIDGGGGSALLVQVEVESTLFIKFPTHLQTLPSLLCSPLSNFGMCEVYFGAALQNHEEGKYLLAFVLSHPR